MPAAALAWRPSADPVPDRWGHAEIALAVAELGEGRLDSAIDALDDARAIDPGAALRVAEITAAGPVHDRLAAQISLRLDMGRTTGGIPRLRRARWLRQIPEGRPESRRILEAALAESPADPRALYEWGAWWLGEPADEGARRRASRELSLAAGAPGAEPSAAILAALLTGDPRSLPVPSGRRPATRLRLARLILSGTKHQQ